MYYAERLINYATRYMNQTRDKIHKH